MRMRYPIRWFAQKQAMLNRLQQTGCACDPYGREAATAQLLAAGGDVDAASTTIHATAADAGDFLALPNATQTDLVSTLFVVQEMGIPADLLRRIKTVSAV